jgi:hypothetical protein
MAARRPHCWAVAKAARADLRGSAVIRACTHQEQVRRAVACGARAAVGHTAPAEHDDAALCAALCGYDRMRCMVEEWDFFISHATEDKESLASPLARELERAGFRVWLDTLEARVGDSIRARIDEGLARSKFGIVILSPVFFAKTWTRAELGALFAMEADDGPRMLPIWYGMSRTEVAQRSPLLADRVAIQSSNPVAIVQQLVRELGPRLDGSASAQRRLVRAIERGRSDEIRAVLAERSDALVRATRLTGGQSVEATARPPAGGQTSPDFFLMSAIVPTLGEYAFAYLTLGPVQATGEREEERKEVEKLVSMTDTFVAAMALDPDRLGNGYRHGSGFVAVGRRATRKAIAGSLDTDIRSYDWLIDAFAQSREDKRVGFVRIGEISLGNPLCQRT